MKKLLIAFLLVASVCGAQTLTVPQVTAPSQSCFVASASAMTPPNTGYSVASFSGTVVKDTLGEFSTSTSRWTAKKAYLKYAFSFNIYFPVGLGGSNAKIYRGGVAQEHTYSATSAGAVGVSGTYIFTDIAVGEIFDVRIYPTNSLPMNPLYCAFSGYELP